MAKIEQTGRGQSVETKLDAEPESNHFAILQELVRDRLQNLMSATKQCWLWRPDMTSSRPTIWPSSSWHQSAYGCVLGSPLPSGDDALLPAFPRSIHDSRPAGRILADASHGHESPYPAATSDLGRDSRRSFALASEIQVPGPCLKQSWTAPLLTG
jgi:hypothetical protein